jgi:hypothetical protein
MMHKTHDKTLPRLAISRVAKSTQDPHKNIVSFFNKPNFVLKPTCLSQIVQQIVYTNFKGGRLPQTFKGW